MLDFYDTVLDGREPDSARVRVYVIGGRRWLDLPAWPPPGAEAMTLGLAPGTVAADPDDPVPSLGGRGLLVQVPGSGFGVRDQRPLAARPDVHVALQEAPGAVTLAGPVRARLAVEAGDEVQWTVTLCVERAGEPGARARVGARADYDSVAAGNVTSPNVSATKERLTWQAKPK